MRRIKVYRVNDCEWVASTSPQDARRWYLNWIGERQDSGDDYCDLEPHEMTEEEMERFTYNDEDYMLGGERTQYSFREALELMIEKNEGLESFYFATTEF